TTSRWRRPRSSGNLFQQVARPAMPISNTHVAIPAPRHERAPSKMSLFNLFSRPKVEKARGHTEVGLAVPMAPPPPSKPAPVSTPKSSLRLNPLPQARQVHRSRSSQMLRPMSMRPASVRKPASNWDPPPLFQAYPQAIKYATLQACVFSPNALLRTQSQRRQNDTLRERMDSHRDLTATPETTAETKKLDKSHKRLISNSVTSQSPSHLTTKVYVLVTSGYLLQYAGDGPFDRLPEKVLKLGKESAAFACDLIPGKHWVLQISQSANEDGTVCIGPKSSLLSRLGLQHASVKRSATSFLLVFENPEEMDSWMTTVRKEIDLLGGMKAREESIRGESIRGEESSSSLEEPPVKAIETIGHRYLVQRSPNRMSKITAIDSPFQSQYSDSPKIVATDWEVNRSQKTVSIADSSSLHSSRHSVKRRSVDAPSIATTTASTDQYQLDQLRERSRSSYMSAATSVSGTQTRNTSPTSSPAPNSPLKEGFSPSEAEPLRSATSLRSFHMAASTRRRSIQPLPVTNEDSSVSVLPKTAQRPSIYGPTSPTIGTPEQLTLDTPPKVGNARFHAQTQAPRHSVRSSSAPPIRNSTISPPPRDVAPVPPGRPQSTIGSLPSAGAFTPRLERRISPSPKPFLRPFPIRPQNTDGSVIVSRRYSSMATPLIPIGIVVNRSVTSPVRTSSAALPTVNRQSIATSQQLRRPNSVQIRSDHAPFLSSIQRPVAAPVRAISSTPSFVPGNRALPNSNRASASPSLSHSSSIPFLRQQAQQAQRNVTPRRSMPVIGLPPPAPPPNMPLPPPPP
ncbi:hypothetical protein K504DRAFT_349426, partial [Pleomassaria siparia CBS 279.74]